VDAQVSHPIDCSKKIRRTTYHLFEEVIECLASAAGRLRLGLRARLALDRDARREQLARIPDVLRRNPHRNFLRAFEWPRRVERFTLRARAKICSAALAAGLSSDSTREHVAAPRAPHHFVKTGDAGRASLERLALGLVEARFDAIGWRLRRLRGARAARRRPALAR